MILNKDADMSLLTDSQKEVISLLLKKSPKERSTAEESLARLEHLNSSLVKGELLTSNKGNNRLAPKLIAGAAVLFGAIGGVLVMQNQSSSPESSRPSASVSPTPVKEKEWSLRVVGDPKAQTGKGEKYSTFICDQGVIEESLKIRELTNPPAEKMPAIKLLKGDSRCGKDFDTILIEGTLDAEKVKREYVLAGSTATGFIIQYEFNITINN